MQPALVSDLIAEITTSIGREPYGASKFGTAFGVFERIETIGSWRFRRVFSVYISLYQGLVVIRQSSGLSRCRLMTRNRRQWPSRHGRYTAINTYLTQDHTGSEHA
jgi:hypothetical protein